MSRQFIRNFELELSKGNISGHTAVHKFGENPDIDTADGFSAIWAGKSLAGGTQNYIIPTQPRIHDLSSSNAADVGTVVSSGTATGGSFTSLEDNSATFVTDGVVVGDWALDDTNTVLSLVVNVTETELTVLGFFNLFTLTITAVPEAGDFYRIVSPTGTGSGVVGVECLDGNFVPCGEFVVLNGTTNVPTVNLCLRINRMRAAIPGAANANVGNISATAQTDGTITAAIVSGDNQTLQCLFTVPSTHNGFIKSWSGSLSKKQAGIANLHLRAGNFDGTMYIFDTHSISGAATSSFSTDMGMTLVPPFADLLIEADVDTNNMSISGEIDLILVEI